MESPRVNTLLERIVIGSAQFGLNYGINNKTGKIPKDKVYEILDFTRNSGIVFVDTAQVYGDSENILGEYVRDRNASLKIISKLFDCAPEKAELLIRESLDKLQTNRLYGILLHCFDTYAKNPMVYKKLELLKEAGLTDKIGFSLYSPRQLCKILDDKIEFDLVQIPYSIFDYRFEKYFPALRKRNVEIHVRSIFLQGLVFMKPLNLPSQLKEFSGALVSADKLSVRLGLKHHELALLFVISNGLIDKVVVGIDNLDHIKEIVSTLNDYSKLEIVSCQKHLFSMLEVKNETILIPSNWN